MRRRLLSNTLIDPNGASFDADVYWRTLDLSDCMTLPSYIDYACRNLGYIAIERTEQATCVSLRPCAISDTSEISMLYQLAEMDRSQRHVLRLFDRSWTHSILPDFNSLLIALQRLRATSMRPDNFVRQIVAPEDPSVPENIQNVISAWQIGSININLHSSLEEYVSSLCDQFMVVRKKKHGELCFEGHGKGIYAVLGGVGLAPLKGRLLASTANQSYVSKATEGYLRTIERGLPTLEKVDALSCMNGNRTLERLRYWRLLVPQKLTNGDALLLSLSVDDSSIDLRRQSI